MGKKTKTKKPRTAKLPKAVLGIRLSKEVREAGGALIEKANSPQGREMLAAGLTMAAAAATAAVAKARTTREQAADSPAQASPPGAERPGATSPQGTQTQPDPQAIVEVVGKAAEAMLGRLFGSKTA
jgi:hypothetical protein